MDFNVSDQVMPPLVTSITISSKTAVEFLSSMEATMHYQFTLKYKFVITAIACKMTFLV